MIQYIRAQCTPFLFFALLFFGSFNVHCDLGLLEMTIHRRVDTDDSPLNDRPVLQFDRDLFTVQFLQEFHELHFSVIVVVAAAATVCS